MRMTSFSNGKKPVLVEKACESGNERARFLLAQDLKKLKSKIPLLDWITAAPERAFAAFALLHATVWTVLPTLLCANLPLDLIEALVYGREWQLGYDKLPPLPWWLVEIAYRTIGHDFAYYLLAQMSVVAAFAFVFMMARPLIGALGALVAVVFLDGLHYFNFTAVKFNHDVVQLPFWALAGFSFHRALRGGRVMDWILLGCAVGISFWAKYFVVVLAAPMILFVVFDRQARANLRARGPYLAVAVALIIMAPHLVWLLRNDFLPLAYAQHRAALSGGWYDHLRHPIGFAASQLFFLLPSLLIVAPLFTARPAAEPRIGAQTDAYDRRIVTCLAFGPILAMLATSAVSGRGAVPMWGYPLWLFLGLWLLLTARGTLSYRKLASILILATAVSVSFLLAFVADYTVLERFDHRYRAAFFPGADLGREISDRYRKLTGKPLKYVIATLWDGGNVSHYAPSRPRVLVDGDPQRVPWIDLADLRRRGAVVVWTYGDRNIVPERLGTLAKAATVQPSFALHYLRGETIVAVGWAILPPISPHATSR